MNQKLPAALAVMLVGVGIFVVSTSDGTTQTQASVTAPQPATRNMAELRDAGITDWQAIVIEESERATKQTKRRIETNQPGLLRPGQSYLHVARTARCRGSLFLDGGFGNCLRVDGGTFAPFIEEVMEWRYTEEDGGRAWLRTGGDTVLLDDGGLWAADRRNDGGLFTRVVDDPRVPDIIIPSLRRDLVGVDLDASVGLDDGGDSDDVDDALQYDVQAKWLHCQQYDALVDAGLRPNPFSNRFCGSLNRVVLLPSPCMIPNGWNRGADGGWCEETACLDPAGPGGYRPCAAGDTCGEVDCKFTGPYGLADGGARWRGFNVGPSEYAVGTACVPVECSVVAGDVPQEWL